MKKLFEIGVIPFILIFYHCSSIHESDQTELNSIAESYVKLVLKLGIYDSDYVDAYYGPEEWKPEHTTAGSNPVFPYPTFSNEVNELIGRLGKLDPGGNNSLWRMRHDFLEKHLSSVRAKIELLAGKKMSFDEESRALYDAAAPAYDQDAFDRSIAAVEPLLPGEGNFQKRWKAFEQKFIVPSGAADTLFRTSLAECRERTLQHIRLPDNENFTIEYVTGKPWGAYNWYQGRSQSLLQFNLGLESTVFSVFNTASHEGYPGHHVHYSLMDQGLYRNKNWVEFSVYPLYSPSSLIAEGVASYAPEMIFSKADRMNYEKQVLFPLAGLDTTDIGLYHQISDMLKSLSGASIFIAREYLDGRCSRDEAIAFAEKYFNMRSEDAEYYVRFIEQYRSYVINYKLGYDLVKNYIEKTDNPKERWKRFNNLLSTPRTASSMGQD